MAHAAGGHQVPHQFESAEQALSASKLGLWLFLVTEVLMFGGLFVGYIIYRAWYPDMFHAAGLTLDWRLGSVNTVALIASSFSMAMGVHYSKTDQPQKAARALLITVLFGAVFMVIKYFEYSHKFHEGMLPGGFYSFEGLTHPKTPIFFSLYFMMTGLHGSHVLVGMGLITWCFLRARKGHFSSAYYTPVELVGYFWHLVDLIWIYLFPLMYLTA
jgi:cytochrome c oxidase subunit 3